QAEDGIRDKLVTGVQTCALPILTTQTGRRDISRRSAETSAGPAGSDRRCTPPIPPVAKTRSPACAAIAHVALTVVPASAPAAQKIGRASCRERAQSPAIAHTPHE